MKKDILMDAMDGIGDDLIDDWQKKRRYDRRKVRIRKYISMAACMTVTVGLCLCVRIAHLGVISQVVFFSPGLQTASVFANSTNNSLLMLFILCLGITITALIYKVQTRKEKEIAEAS